MRESWDGQTAALVAVGVLLALDAIVTLRPDPRRAYDTALSLAGLISFVLLADSLRRGPRAALLAAGAIAISVGYAFAFGHAWSPVRGWRVDWPQVLLDPLAVGAACWAPAAILASRKGPKWPAVACAAAALVWAAMAGPHLAADAAIQRGTFDGGTAWSRAFRAGLWLPASFAIGSLAAGCIAGAIRTQPRAGSRAVPAPIVAGVVVLGISWALGGYLLFLPIWILAVALLAVPSLSRARQAPLAFGVTCVLLVAGAVPAFPCVREHYTDAISDGGDGRTAYRAWLPIAALAGHGPYWTTGFHEGDRYECGPGAWGATFVWLGGIVVCGVLVHRRTPTHREPFGEW